MARILGPDNDIELVSFRGSDLSGGEDINIVQGSSLPEMKSAQQDRIMTLWDKGAIVKKDGSPDPQALLKLMGMGDSNELFEMQQLDENKAKMENKQFEQLAQNPEALQLLQQYTMQEQQFEQQAQEMQAQGVIQCKQVCGLHNYPYRHHRCVISMIMKCTYICIMHSGNQVYTMSYHLKYSS